MLIRLFTYLFTALANGASCLFAVAQTKRHSRSRERTQVAVSRPTSVVLGREIVNLSDVSTNPTLGEPLEVSFADLLSHIYGPGRTGAGKTSLLTVLVDAFVAHKQTFCIIDARGDLIARLLTRLANVGDANFWKDRLVIIDLPSEWSVPFNPFAAGGDPYSIATSILDAIEERTSGGLGVQVSETLRSSLLSLAFGRGRWTLLHIEPLLTNQPFRESVLKSCTDPLVLGFWERYQALSSDQKNSWTGAVLNKVTPLLAVPQMRRSIGQNGCLPFRKLIDTPGQVILVRLGISELHGPAGLFGSMVASAIIQAAMSRATDTVEAERNPLYVLCDEFENYCNPLFHEAIQEGRRMKCGIALFHQNVSQIKSATADLILNNAKTMCLFSTGARDAAHFSREIGGDEAWDARTILTRQAVGQAYLLRRGQEPKRVQISYTPDPDIDPRLIAAIRSGAFATFARSAEMVDAEITESLASIQAMKRPKPTDEPSKAADVSEAPAVEVREVPTRRRSRKETKNVD